MSMRLPLGFKIVAWNQDIKVEFETYESQTRSEALIAFDKYVKTARSVIENSAEGG